SGACIVAAASSRRARVAPSSRHPGENPTEEYSGRRQRYSYFDLSGLLATRPDTRSTPALRPTLMGLQAPLARQRVRLESGTPIEHTQPAERREPSATRERSNGACEPPEYGGSS